MAYLTIPTFGNVPVANEDRAASQEVEENEAAHERAYDGTMHTAVQWRKRKWPVETQWMTRSDFDSMKSALEGTPPLSCSGDLLGGSVDCHCGPVQVIATRNFQPGEYVRGSFTLMEE